MDWLLVYSDYVAYSRQMRLHSIANASIETLKLTYMKQDEILDENEFRSFFQNMPQSERSIWQRKWKMGYAIDLTESMAELDDYRILNPEIRPDLLARLQAITREIRN